MATVNANMFDAGVSHESPLHGPALMALPLNLIALIVAHLEDVGDLSRLCRTCRVLNYMTLPLLYKNLTLTSYDKIRYNRDHVPEGYGSASPFSMGLNAVVTRNVASLVRSLRLRGEWREDGLDEHARVGRVPDSSMMLNIAVRAAIDRTTELESFSWELNTKMLETVYLGLSQLPKLRSLTVRFPSSRHPRPTTIIPAMPHLRSLKVTDIDPLCYPDDISTLLSQSKKLRELKMHWSTRMKEAQEPSVTLHEYFRKCIANKSPLRIKKLSFQNFYALQTSELEQAMDHSFLEETTVLSSPGVSTTAAAMTFVEASWRPSRSKFASIKSFRNDRVERKGCEFLSELVGLEKLYFVNPLRDAFDYVNSPRAHSTNSSISITPPSRDSSIAPVANGHNNKNISQPAAASSAPSPPSPNLASQTSLRDMYIQMITNIHGPRLKHLILPSQWSLPTPLLSRLVRSCYNLEQLAVATNVPNFETLSLLIPFLRKLVAIRILIPTPPANSTSDPRSAIPTTDSLSKSYLGNGDSSTFASDPQYVIPSAAQAIAELVDLDDQIHNETIGSRFADKEIFSTLKVLGLGWKAWELGGFYQIPASGVPFNWKKVNSRMVDDPNDIDFAIPPAPENSIPASNARLPGQSCGLNPFATSGTTTSPQPPPPPPPPQPLPPQQQQTSSTLGKRKHGAGDTSQSTTSHQQPTPLESLLDQPHHQILQRNSESNSYIDPNNNNINISTGDTGNTANPDHGTSTSIRREQFSLVNNLAPHLSQEAKTKIVDCMDQTSEEGIGDDKFLWRRHVRRVGWDVLKDWEVWGLDVQEI